MIIFAIVYLIGAILAYGKVNAGLYEIDERYINSSAPEIRSNVIYSMGLATFSWITFISGILFGYLGGYKYFLKYSYKDLRRKWEDIHMRKLNKEVIYSDKDGISIN
jgi:hypothetical protein